MSKALIVKGADFAQNAVEQIIVSDPIPCTGISLSRNALNLTIIGATELLTANVEPLDTTERIVWASSDDMVATVQNGIVTSTGVGTATITATCGKHTASCLVTATAIINANEAYLTINGYELTNGKPSADKDFVGTYASAKKRIYANSDNTVDAAYQVFSVKGTHPHYGLYPLLIPNGASRITVASTAFTVAIFAFVDALAKSDYSAYSSEKVVSDMTSQTFTNGIAEIAIPEVTADKLCFVLGLTASVSADEITDDVTVTFS